MKKLTLQPIRSLANIIPINARLRALYFTVNKLIDEVNTLKGETPTEAETVSIDPVTVTETVAADIDFSKAQAESEPFNWLTSEDVPALKAHAKSIGAKVAPATQKAETIKKAIKAHLEEKED